MSRDTVTRDKQWYELPRPAAMAKLVEVRNELREKNLHDTEEPKMPEQQGPVAEELKAARTVDGSYNDLKCPMMGATGRRFGRNVPLTEAVPDTANLLNPNPRDISNALFTRTKFQPATILNVLAAAWIQFQVHDWFVHTKGTSDNTHNLPLADNDSWFERPMRVPKTPVDPPTVANSNRPPAYVNNNSHWWDGSNIYGSTKAEQDILRAGKDGKVKVQDDGRLFFDETVGTEITGSRDNLWVGLSLLHSLFAREHNAVCDMLKAEHKDWDDQRLFQQARLILSALMAKIHTVEWTPAILPHPLLVLALNTNWHGLAPRLQKVFHNLADNDLLSGIPGSPTDHHTAPYALTEEFASVYRMHSLLPDDFEIRSVKDNSLLQSCELPEMSGRAGRKIVEKHNCADLFYSLGTSYPGALRLHNFPKHLQNLHKDTTGERLDLAAVDILRDRERGVPRYNQFRRLFHKPSVKTFDELCDNKEWAEEIKRAYGGDIEKVDLLVGLMAEPLPEGMGFSDTAFRVFILMASRRLKSDRFLSAEYGPARYTQAGIDWIENTTMLDVITRHVPEVKPALGGITNAFHPWHRVR
ncbi:MAG TPA: peroxidase family protein [Vicinamibacterales bacterium]|jgi:hypothetical protein|nr:peroxidase family protein [Vicinamibacterales bacterium]